MPEREFDDNVRRYAAGEMSRRRFINRMVLGGATIAAAVTFANATVTAALAAPTASGHVYGTYGTTTTKPAAFKPPGLGGTPPGKGGTPPGKSLKP